MNITLNTNSSPYITFLKVFLSINLEDSKELKVLELLILDANERKVSLTTARRKMLMEKLNLTKQQLSTIISKLITKGLLIGKDGEYELHKELLPSGTATTITIKLKAQ